MAFTDFIETIEAPSLQHVAAHWQDAGGRRRMPAWSDIKPSFIAAQLPIVWSYKFDTVTKEFTGRLAGDVIANIFQKNFRGLPLRDAHPAHAFRWAYGLCQRVVMEPALHRATGQVFKQLDRFGLGERIMLPLSEDGVIADGILGATEYGLHSEVLAAPVDAMQGAEHWFSL